MLLGTPMPRADRPEAKRPAFSRATSSARTTSTLVKSRELTLQRIGLNIVEPLEVKELWSCSCSASDERGRWLVGLLGWQARWEPGVVPVEMNVPPISTRLSPEPR